MAEYSVIDAKYLVKVPKELIDRTVLTEPLSVVEKGIDMGIRMGQARFEWKPRNALVLGAGPVGLLATMVLRLVGSTTVTTATRPPESLKTKFVTELGSKYVDLAME